MSGNITGKKRKREDEDYVPNFDEEESEEEYNPDGEFADSPKQPPQKKLKLMTIFAPIGDTILRGSYSTTTSTITTPTGTFSPVDDISAVDMKRLASSIAFVAKPPPKVKKRNKKFPFKNPERNSSSGRTRSFRQLNSAESKRIGDLKDPTYSSIEASMSTGPKKHYCDITGLEGKYVDPRSKLRYHSQKVFGLISEFKNDRLKNQFINLRKGKTIK